MRIAFVAPPFAGHLYPLIPLARAARQAGYSVVFVTGERKQPVLRQHGLAATALPGLSGDRLESIANWPRRVGSNPAVLLAQFRQNLRMLPVIREELAREWRRETPDLVVADSVAVVAGPVCDEMGIPGSHHRDALRHREPRWSSILLRRLEPRQPNPRCRRAASDPYVQASRVPVVSGRVSRASASRVRTARMVRRPSTHPAPSSDSACASWSSTGTGRRHFA